MKLMMSKYKVHMPAEDNCNEFYVHFEGPKDSIYEGGHWNVHVSLPEEYPYKSPSIGFCNTIYHPNVDEASGSVCLDVINQTWSPMFELVNVFDVFLPQLLSYPNASDPLNQEAAALQMADTKAYETRVREYIKEYASIPQDLQLTSPNPTADACTAGVTSKGRSRGGSGSQTSTDDSHMSVSCTPDPKDEAESKPKDADGVDDDDDDDMEGLDDGHGEFSDIDDSDCEL